MTTEQRINLKFLVRLGKTPSDALGMLQEVYGDETMSCSRVFEWHKRFKEGHKDVEDDSRSGKPSTSRTANNVECVKQMVRGDCRLTVRMIADELEINRDSVWKIITEDLGMRKICAKMIPKLLDDNQEWRVEVCQDILEHLQTEPDLLQRVITDDESWIFDYDPETKRQSLQWKCPSSPKPKKARQSRSQNQAHADRILRCERNRPHGVLATGVTQSTSMSTKRSCGACFVQCARRGASCGRTTHGWFTRTTCQLTMPLSIRRFLAERNVTVVDHPPYSLDLAPCDFFLFPKLKEVIKGVRFLDMEVIKKAVTTECTPSRSAWRHGRTEWESALDSKEDYFEGENL